MLSQFHHRRLRYSIEHPTQWQVVEHEDGAVEFWFPDRTRAVGLTVFQPATPSFSQGSSDTNSWELFARSLLQQSESIDVKPDPTLSYPNLSADRNEPDQAGKRWVIAAPSLTLCISTCVPASERDSMTTILESMLKSLRIEDTEQLVSNIVDQVTATLRDRLPNDRVIVANHLLKVNQLELPIDEMIGVIRSRVDVAMNSINPQSTPNADRQSITSMVVEQFVDSLMMTLGAASNIETEVWSDVQHRILPLLKPSSYVRDVNQRNAASSFDTTKPSAILISVPWLTDLRVCFAIDDRKTFRYINDSDIHRWNVTVEDLCGAALNNLTDLPFPEFIVQKLPEADRKIAVLEPSVGAASSFVLHPDFFLNSSRRLGNRIVFGIPTRDVCILFEDQEEVTNMKQAISIEYQKSDHRLSQQLFRMSHDGLEIV